MEQNILSDVADVVIQEPVELEVDVRPRNRLHAFLQRIRILPKKRTLTIRPICYGSLIRISKMLLEIQTDGFDVNNMLESNYTLIKDHGRQVAAIVATAIHNRRSATPESLVSFIEDNFTSEELLKSVLIVLRQMNLKDFLNTIISIRGMNVLEKKTASVKNAESEEVSPKTQGS